MLYRRLFALVVLIPFFAPATLSAQSALRYQFKPGEHLQYHYTYTSTVDRMRKKGRKEWETVFEADPDWQVKDVDMDGAATVLFTVANRREKYEEGTRRLNFIHMPPQSQISVSAKGRLLYGKILIDDAERTRSKKAKKDGFDVKLNSDRSVLDGYLKKLWWAIDTVAVDTNGTPHDHEYDKVWNAAYEHDTALYGRMGHFKVGDVALREDKGKATYTMRDTVVGGQRLWSLHIIRDGKELQSENYINEYHRTDDILFRKSDGLIHRWEAQIEDHNGVAVFSTDEVLELKKIEGD